MVKDKITYRGLDWPLRVLTIPGYGEDLLIGSTDLYSVLFEGYASSDRDAEEVDDQIFFYVEPSELELPDREIKKVVEENL
jgi:hypothetical protein